MPTSVAFRTLGCRLQNRLAIDETAQTPSMSNGMMLRIVFVNRKFN